MKFNLTESNLIIYILQNILENLTEKNASQGIILQNLMDKIIAGEYIKGRLLNLLYSEINSNNCHLTNEQNILLTNVQKRIKFKATPR